MIKIKNFKLPEWYLKEAVDYPILDFDEFDEYYHIFCAKREQGVRFSLGCVNKIDDKTKT